jgi:hypothetical protein
VRTRKLSIHLVLYWNPFESIASRNIPGQTVVDVSPILYFSKDEYEAHGKYTILDHYTFKCRDGRMALALGLGTAGSHFVEGC